MKRYNLEILGVSESRWTGMAQLLSTQTIPSFIPEEMTTSTESVLLS